MEGLPEDHALGDCSAGWRRLCSSGWMQGIELDFPFFSHWEFEYLKYLQASTFILTCGILTILVTKLLWHFQKGMSPKSPGCSSESWSSSTVQELGMQSLSWWLESSKQVTKTSQLLCSSVTIENTASAIHTQMWVWIGFGDGRD